MSDVLELAPRVSVIIPCYNRDQFVRETIDSVLSQTYDNVELVVIDDGCTDGSRQILEGYKGALRILEHPNRENRGQAAGVNLGIASTHGEFIAILDSDDVWMPTKLSEQVQFLQAHPDIGLVYGNGEAIDEVGKKLYTIYPNDHSERSEPERVLMDCYFFLPTNSLVRRSVYEQAGKFDESLRAAQDHDMAVRIAEVTRLAYVNRDWFKYRRHADTISRKATDLRWRAGFYILEKARARYPYSQKAVRTRRGVLHFRTGQFHFQSGHWLAGAGHMLRAFVNDPVRAVRVVLGNERAGSPY